MGNKHLGRVSTEERKIATLQITPWHTRTMWLPSTQYKSDLNVSRPGSAFIINMRKLKHNQPCWTNTTKGKQSNILATGERKFSRENKKIRSKKKLPPSALKIKMVRSLEFNRQLFPALSRLRHSRILPSRANKIASYAGYAEH